MLQVANPTERIHQAHFQPRQQSSHPPFTLSVTRPSSASNDSPGHHKYGSAHIPALAALASLAASAPAAPVKRESISEHSDHSPQPDNMSAPQYAPAATAGGQQNGPPVCQNCTTSTTPLWRRDESGSVLCNACGLFLKLHGRARPISLKTDVIKSRNRVKTSQTPRKHDRNGNPADSPQNNSQPGPGFPAAHPDVAHAQIGAQAYPPHGLPHTPQMGGGLAHAQGHDRVPSPGAALSRSGTPSQHQNPNIAPQHIFDTVSLPVDSFASPAPHHLEAPQSFDALAAQNNALRTRVSELEVINDLFKGRVSELESSEQEARRELAELKREIENLKRVNIDKVAETVEEPSEERAAKKAKLDDTNDKPKEASEHIRVPELTRVGETPVVPIGSTPDGSNKPDQATAAEGAQ